MLFEEGLRPFRRLYRRIGDEGCVALAAAFAWLLRLLSHTGLGFGAPRWASWYDQGRYLASSTAFLHGNLAGSEHHYPLLYPLLATPFLLLDPCDPFVLPDMALFALTMVAVVRVAKRLGIGPVPATVFALLACLGQRHAANAWLDPWTTTLAAALIWWLIDRSLVIVLPVDRDVPTAFRAFPVLGALAAALPLTRPADSVASAACLLLVSAVLLVQRRLTPRMTIGILAGGLVIALPYAMLHLAIYGPQATAYMKGTAEAGFVFSDVPWKAYTLLVSARPWYPDTRSMIEALPWLLPAAAGAVLMLARPGLVRAPLLVVLAIALPYALFYSAFSDLMPPGLWAFGNAHYFKWLFPLAGLMLWVWLRAFASWRGATGAISALLVTIAPTTIRALPVPVAADRPARMLLFRGSTARDWNEAYFAPAATIDPAGNRMHNIGGFHQIPDASGERAIAIQRLFVPNTVRDDPGEAAAFAQPQRPYARYGVALSIGLPCWLRRAACAMPLAR